MKLHSTLNVYRLLLVTNENKNSKLEGLKEMC